MTTERTMTWLAIGLLWLVGDVSGRTDHCVPQKAHPSGFLPFSCHYWFQSIFVMQTTQNRVPYHLLTTRNSLT